MDITIAHRLCDDVLRVLGLAIVEALSKDLDETGNRSAISIMGIPRGFVGQRRQVEMHDTDKRADQRPKSTGL